MTNGNFPHLASHSFCRFNDVWSYYTHCHDLGGGRGRRGGYLHIELWVDGGRRARSQTVWNREEFETFTVRGLIVRTNHPSPNGYLEASEASQMFCGKHHTFSNARVCAKWCVIYKASIDRPLPLPCSCGIVDVLGNIFTCEQHFTYLVTSVSDIFL